MADGSYLGKIEKNRHISANAWPIATKFGMLTQFVALNPPDRYNFENLKIKDGGGRHLEKKLN